MLELGNVYALKLDLINEGRKAAEEIVARCDETVQMAILEGTDAVFVAKVDCSKMVRMVSHVGSRLPAHCTAVGKMLLSSLSDAQVGELYGELQSLQRMTPNSITSLAQLKHELSAIRRRGLSYDDCESNIDVSCVSAPVYNQYGKMVAAMSVSVPITRIAPSRQDGTCGLDPRGEPKSCPKPWALGARLQSASGSPHKLRPPPSVQPPYPAPGIATAKNPSFYRPWLFSMQASFFGKFSHLPGGTG